MLLRVLLILGVEGGDTVMIFARQVKYKAASLKSGEERGTGRNGINTPGGKAGERIRMYHPRFGRCIDQQIVELWLCYVNVRMECEISVACDTRLHGR